jgi:hypothetical protein
MSKLLEESAERRSADPDLLEDEEASAISAFQIGGLAVALVLHLIIKLWIG